MSQRVISKPDRTATTDKNEEQTATPNDDATQQEETTCPECNGNVITDSGERLCGDCGLVINDQNIDHGPEWRAFDEQERRNQSRTGRPSTELLHDKGLTTEIDWRGRDGNGNQLNFKRRKKMNRLRKWHNRHRAKNPSERSLRHAIGEIKRMASALGIPEDTQELASRVYQQCLDQDMIRGHSIEGIASAALYTACRINNVPRSLDEVAQVSRIEKGRVSRDYRHISNGLPIDIKPPKPLSFVPKIASEVEVSQDIQKKAEDLLSKMVDRGEHSGKHPTGLAAGAIYAANYTLGKPEKLTQAELADAARVTKVTVRSHYKTLIEYDE